MGKLDLNLNFYFMEAMNFNSKLYVCSLRASGWMVGWLEMQSEHKLKFINSLISAAAYH